MSGLLVHWKPHPVLAGAPPALHPWLSDAASLTARIVARCRHFRVQVVCETHTRPSLDEHHLIGLPLARHAWVREVLLIADGTPVVFAHSVLRLTDLTGAWHMARAIGSRPLGAALFADPGICREALACARLTAGHPLHRRAQQALEPWRGAGLLPQTTLQPLPPLPPLWARRSRFYRAGRPLLVTEVFLPGLARLSPGAIAGAG